MEQLRQSYLRGCNIDSAVADQLKLYYAPRLERHTQNKILVCQGDESNGCYYVLLDGEVKLEEIDPSGRIAIHFICVAPSVFGESAFINKARDFFAETMTDCTVLKLYTDEPIEPKELECALLKEIVRVVCAKDYTHRKVIQSRRRDIPLKQDMMNILLDLSMVERGKGRVYEALGRKYVKLSYTQQSLADFAQASRGNVSKALSELQKESKIAIDNRQLIVFIEE